MRERWGFTCLTTPCRYTRHGYRLCMTASARAAEHAHKCRHMVAVVDETTLQTVRVYDGTKISQVNGSGVPF